MKGPCLLVAALSLLTGAALEVRAQNEKSRAYPPLSSLVTLGRRDVSIGSEDKVGPTLFGAITAIALDSALNIYVLDHENHAVRSFSRSGRFLHTAGRAGRGPADFTWPSSLFHDGASRLYVFDRVNGVVVFETRDGVMTHQRSFGSEFLPTNACALGDTLLLAGWRGKKILHVLSPEGDLLRSFGEGFIADTSERLRNMAGNMPIRINCDVTTNRIYVTPNAAGVVRAYHPDGRLLWQQELPDFHGHRFLMTAQGATVVYGQFNTESLLRVGKDLLLVPVRHIERVRSPQVNQFGGRGSVEDREPVTYVLSARTGQLLTRVTGVPLLGAVRGDLAVGYEHNPFPRLFTMSWREATR